MDTLASNFGDFGLGGVQKTRPSSPTETLFTWVHNSIANHSKFVLLNGVIGNSLGSEDSPSLAKFKKQLGKLSTAAKDGTLAPEGSSVDYVKSKQEVQDSILAFGELLSCWDGDAAEPIARGAIDSAHRFLESYHGDLKFDAFPDPDGSVGLQADFAKGRVILSFDAAGEGAYLIRIDNAIHRGHGATHEVINSLFSSLL